MPCREIPPGHYGFQFFLVVKNVHKGWVKPSCTVRQETEQVGLMPRLLKTQLSIETYYHSLSS